MLGDYFMIVSANNIKQSQSIADEIEDIAKRTRYDGPPS